MEEKWSLLVSHPHLVDTTKQVASLAAETVTSLQKSEVLQWTVSFEDSEETKSAAADVRISLQRKGLQLVESSPSSNCITLQSWSSFSRYCSSCNLPPQTILLALRGSALQCTKVLSDLSPSTELSAAVAARRCPAAMVSAAATEVCSAVQQRLQASATCKSQLLVTDSWDLAEGKRRLAEVILETQEEILTLGNTLTRSVERALDIDTLKQQHESSLQALSRLAEDCSSHRKADFSDVERRISDLETRARSLLVHLASLKSSRKSSRRPIFQLYKVSDSDGSRHLAIYNRAQELIDGVMICVQERALRDVQEIAVQPHLTLVDFSLLPDRIDLPVCLAKDGEVLSNFIRLRTPPPAPLVAPKDRFDFSGFVYKWEDRDK